jgi:hypothetical protein
MPRIPETDRINDMGRRYDACDSSVNPLLVDYIPPARSSHVPADAASSPTVTLAGPALVALWLAATAEGRIERMSLRIAAGVFVCLTFASVTGLGEVHDTLTRIHGGTARSLALGAVLVVAGSLARQSEAGVRRSAG